MTTDQARAFTQKLQSWKEEIQTRTGKTPEQLYREREKRITDCVELREPDSIPLWFIAEGNPRLNLKPAAAFYDPVVWKEALVKEILEFEPDLYIAIFGGAGHSWEALDIKNKLWPGGTLPPEYEYQFVEGEYMKADEYDLFLSDPSDFMLRYYLPRVYNALAPLAKLPSVSLMYNSFEYITDLFTSPEFARMAKAVVKAGKELEKHRLLVGNTFDELAALGYPDLGHGSGAGLVPFDTISSFFRGMKGSMLDMYRQPEKLLQACDVVLKKHVAMAKPADRSQPGSFQRSGMPLWRGDCSFMSEAQFARFYWPGFKQALMAAIDLGYIPVPLFEAKFGKRLERLLELPKGKVVAVVEHMDIIPAREMLGGHVCIVGKPPVSLHYASVQETLDYYRDLLVTKKCGKGGGLILRMVLPQQASVAELKKMLKTIREYCRY
jgi:hypothetical protein